MYTVSQIIISETKYPSLYQYAIKNSELANNLYNAALFRIRQIFTGYDKQIRTKNEKAVFELVNSLEKAYPSVKVKRVISYSHLEKLMRLEHNPDFFSGLPMQTAQHVLRQAVTDFTSWLKSLKSYKNDSSCYTGRPRMPQYRKGSLLTFTITNQDAVLYPFDNDSEYGTFLKLPLSKERISLSHIHKDSVMKEVKVIPFYGRFILSITLDIPKAAKNSDMHEMIGIDLGTDNIAALVCTDGSSRLYKGGVVLSENQNFAKSRAKAVGMITKGHNRVNASSKHLDNLSFHHCNFNRDQMHKISRSIINYCVSHKVGTIVIGENRLWKQISNIGVLNNQKFVSVPLDLLKKNIIYKAQTKGITVILQEESYTSKADFLACDSIPVYGKNDDAVSFSGKRICRGLYKSKAGVIVNADLNGAANILRKAVPDAWNNTTDFTFLNAPDVLGFHELNPQSIPVKRIAGM